MGRYCNLLIINVLYWKTPSGERINCAAALHAVHSGTEREAE